MEYPNSKNVTTSTLCSSSGSPIHIESIVKITVSPNTPSPSLSPEPSGHDHEDHQYINSSEPVPVVETVRCSAAAGETFRECSCSGSVPTTILTDVGAMGNCKNLTSYQKIEDSQGQSSTSVVNHNNSSSNGEHHHNQHNEPSNTTDLPICFDFGIQDYLCRRVEETEFDLSSDTDTSYLGASPPFGEALCQSSIEAMPILLDTRLNLHEDDDDDELSREEVEELASRLSLNLKDTKKNNSSNFFGQSRSKESLLSFHATPPRPPSSPPTNEPNSNDTKSKGYQERRFPRPFRRNISLPAIFKSYLQQNTEFTNLKEKKSAGQQQKSGMPRDHRLSRIESISNSSRVNLEDGQDSLGSSMTSVASNWNAGSIDSDVENEPFTSDVEKRSLMIRHMRSLIRQNTTGNFAPADYHI